MATKQAEIAASDVWQNRIVGLLLGVTAVILPVILVPTGWDAWRFPKVLVVRAAAILLLTVFALFTIWSPRPWQRIREAMSDRLMQVGLFIIFWVGLSATFSPQPSVSWWAWGDVVAGMTLFYAARSHARRTGSRRLLWLMLIPACINGGVILLQHYDIWHPMIESIEELDGAPREDAALLRKAALLGNRNDVGMYLVASLLVSLYLLSAARRLGTRLISGSVLGLLALSLVFTTTLTAIAAGVVSCVLFLLILIRARAGARMKTAGVLLLLPVLCLSILAIQPDVRERTKQYATRIVDGDFDIFGQRQIAFASAALMSRDHPLFGVGPGRYSVEQVEFSSELIAAAPETFRRSWQDPWFDMVHNDFLEASAEGGIPLALGVVAFGIVFVTNARRSRRDRLGALAISLLVAIAIEMMPLFPLQVAAVYGTYALAGGLAQADATRS